MYPRAVILIALQAHELFILSLAKELHDISKFLKHVVATNELELILYIFMLIST